MIVSFATPAPPEVPGGLTYGSVIEVTSPTESYVYVTVRPIASVTVAGKPWLL